MQKQIRCRQNGGITIHAAEKLNVLYNNHNWGMHDAVIWVHDNWSIQQLSVRSLSNLRAVFPGANAIVSVWVMP